MQNMRLHCLPKVINRQFEHTKLMSEEHRSSCSHTPEGFEEARQRPRLWSLLHYRYNTRVIRYTWIAETLLSYSVCFATAAKAALQCLGVLRCRN